MHRHCREAPAKRCANDTKWLTPCNGVGTFPHACSSLPRRLPARARRARPGARLASFVASSVHFSCVTPESSEEQPMTATLEPTTTPQAGKPATATAADVIRKARDAGVQAVDFRFTDPPGTWQDLSSPPKVLTEGLFKEWIG